jgi:protein-S-isoprenylcysteine O-methyltransferase Ste14
MIAGRGYPGIMGLAVFKFLQFAVLLVFIAFISDFRKKRGMVPLVGEGWTCLLKGSYLAPLFVYGHALFFMRHIAWFDYAALGLTLLGTAIVIKAKMDLSLSHTWVGYCLASTGHTTKGIYSYMRHPLYTGIAVLVLGSLFTILPRLNLSKPLLLPAAALISVAYIMGFLIFLANKETVTLLEKYGDPFRQYKEKVHAFLPLRKYYKHNG